MQCNRLSLRWVSYGLASSLLLATPAQAQVTTDGSLNTQVTAIAGRNFIITNGTAAGTNLFHSFRGFSIPTGGSATFNLTATPNVLTIFGRVTGNNVSSIDGLIRTSGSTNPVSLFLLNPNGVVFGSNAFLNIGGSFVGTTATSLRFADGVEFGTTSPPLLTMSAPIGLQFGQNPGAIRVQGKGHNLSSDNPLFTPYLPTALSLSGLRVQAGKTIALIGGEVALNGGMLYAPGGRIEVGGVASGQVAITPTPQGYTFDYASVPTLQNVQMTQRSLLDVGSLFDLTGRSAGSIQVQGRNIRLSDGSLVLSQHRSLRPAGELTVRATELLEILGTTPDEKISSGIISETVGVSAASNLNIAAKGILLQSGGAIGSRTFTTAPTGTITVNATDFIQMSGLSSKTNVFSSLATVSLNRMPQLGQPTKAGSVTVSTRQLSLRDGAAIAAISIGYGSAGDIVVNADTTEIIGGAKDTPAGDEEPTAIISISYRLGNSSTIELNTRTLALRNGGVISSSNLGIGNSGSVKVNASESIQVSSQYQVDGWYSSISSTLGNGVYNRQFFNPREIVRGDAGSVTINTPALEMNQAGISVANYGIGAAGTLRINADAVKVANYGGIAASTFSGEGGNIVLESRTLLLRNNSAIVTNASSIGNGGDISISAPLIIGTGNSDIIANAVQNQGGKIEITTQGIFGLAFRDLLNPREVPTNDITASSELSTNGMVKITTLGADPNAGLVELSGDVIDSNHAAQGCAGVQESSFVVSGRGGIAIKPTEEVTSDRTWTDLRDLSAFQQSATVQPSAPSLMEATHWRKTESGKVELMADPLATHTPPATCTPAS